MGDSHYKSNIRSFDGTQVITGFNRIATVNSITATDITANGSVTGANLAGTNYIRVGTKKIIFPTAYSTAASINAEEVPINFKLTVTSSKTGYSKQLTLTVKAKRTIPVYISDVDSQKHCASFGYGI